MACHEAPPSLWFGPLVLGGVGLVVGLVPALVDAPLALAVAAVARRRGTSEPRALARLQRHSVLSVVTLVGSLGLFVSRGHDQARTLAARARHRTAVHARAGDARRASADASAPALQSASLRSYVLTIVVTLVTLVGRRSQ